VLLAGSGLVGLGYAQAAPDPSVPGSELVAAQVQALEVEPTGVNVRGELSLVLLEPPDRELPLELRLEDGPVAVDQNRLDWSAVADPLALQPRLRAAFTAPAEPGSYAVEGSVTYWVCDDRWCRRKHGTLQWTLDISAQAEDA
jgi:hypothetical protein